MDYDVIEARFVGRHVIWLRFRDNTSGEIDLEKELYGPVFQPLRDTAVFRQFQIHPEFTRSRGPAVRTSPRSSCTTTCA